MALNRGLFTTELLTRFRKTLLCGDNIAPYEGGWPTGTPGEGVFTDYLVLTAGRVEIVESALRTACNDYDLHYVVSAFSSSRKGVDDLAHLAHEVVEAGNHPIIGSYKVQKISFKSYGRMVRNDATDPPLWSVADTLVVKCVPWG